MRRLARVACALATVVLLMIAIPIIFALAFAGSVYGSCKARSTDTVDACKMMALGWALCIVISGFCAAGWA